MIIDVEDGKGFFALFGVIAMSLLARSSLEEFVYHSIDDEIGLLNERRN